MTISRTSSRKSAPSFTSKRQRQARKPVRNLDLKRARVRAPKKVQANPAKETSSTRSSKSSTKTRRNKRKQFHDSTLRKMDTGTNKKIRKRKIKPMAAHNVKPLDERVLVHPIEEQE